MIALAFANYIVGLLFCFASGADGGRRLGHTLTAAGAIMIAGLFVGVVIIEAGGRPKSRSTYEREQ